ncbi:MAG: GNAT family N-acetyltransferase [Bacteroidetes bacterium]|nr:GNAT family N-acetyltransferase [Bacteroidota bacterium]
MTDKTIKIRLAVTKEQIRKCYPVIFQLRPHLTESEFVSRVQIQKQEGYHLVFLEENGEIRAVGGYRFATMLSRGRFMYIDDLVTDEPYRAHGHGLKMMAWMIQKARDAGCSQIDLDSGIQRKESHEFYQKHGMSLISWHFSQKLVHPGPGQV